MYIIVLDRNEEWFRYLTYHGAAMQNPYQFIHAINFFELQEYLSCYTQPIVLFDDHFLATDFHKQLCKFILLYPYVKFVMAYTWLQYDKMFQFFCLGVDGSIGKYESWNRINDLLINIEKVEIKVNWATLLPLITPIMQSRITSVQATIIDYLRIDYTTEAIAKVLQTDEQKIRYEVYDVLKMLFGWQTSGN